MLPNVRFYNEKLLGNDSRVRARVISLAFLSLYVCRINLRSTTYLRYRYVNIGHPIDFCLCVILCFEKLTLNNFFWQMLRNVR